MSNWPAGLPFTSSTVTDSAIITRDQTYWYTNVIKPVSDAITALLGDTAWTAAALTGGWVPYASGYRPQPGYRTNGILVRLSGLVKSGGTGSGNPIMTLPVAPSAQLTFVVQSNAGAAYLIIDTSGRVYVSSYQTGGSNADVALDNIIFMAD